MSGRQASRMPGFNVAYAVARLLRRVNAVGPEECKTEAFHLAKA